MPNSRQRTFFSPFLNNRPVPRNSSIRPFRCALAKALFSESFENHSFMSTFQKRCTWNNFTKSMQFVSLFENGLHSFFGQAVPLGSSWVKYYKSVQFTKTYQLTWTVHFLSTNSLKLFSSNSENCSLTSTFHTIGFIPYHKMIHLAQIPRRFVQLSQGIL